MFDKLLPPDFLKNAKDALKFMATKANETAENSKESLMVQQDILEELKKLNTNLGGVKKC